MLKKKSNIDTRVKFKLILYFVLGLSFSQVNAAIDPECELLEYNRGDWEFNSKRAYKRLLNKEMLRQEKIGSLNIEKMMDHYTGKEEDIYKKDKNGNLVLDVGGIKIRNMNVDHVVPLKYAHLHGGCKWSIDKKREFANNPKNLKMTTRMTNLSKGAKGPEKFLPAGNKNTLRYLKMWREAAEGYSSIPVYDSLYAANILRALKQQSPTLFRSASKTIQMSGRVVLVIGALDITYIIGQEAYEYYLNHYSDDEEDLKFSILYENEKERLTAQPY